MAEKPKRKLIDIEKNLILIFINKYNLNYTVVNYEALVLNGKDYLNQILNEIGLVPIKNINIKNGNIKYYDTIKR